VLAVVTPTVEAQGEAAQRPRSESNGAGPRKSVAIVGARGYTGQELQRLIGGHGGLDTPLLLSARGPEPLDPEILEDVDGVFLCTPHGTSQPLVRAALERGCRVVDLSADFRLRSPDVYAASYGHEHSAPELLDDAVYGLTEHARTRVAGARLVANPGCYPTSVLLPLLPLLSVGLVSAGSTVVCDCKSGVSGAGNNPGPRTIFGSVHENFSAYAVGGHRHLAEIHQEAGTSNLLFVPHLLPVFRGILSTIYVRPVRGVDVEDMREHLRHRYEGEPFVRVLHEGDPPPELADVQRTNQCRIQLTAQGDHVVLVSAIDNLVKGAAGQALQNMNLMLGFPEDAGLT
jgi:N-acetyl-gamma-glutamyl-phosphate reductase